MVPGLSCRASCKYPGERFAGKPFPDLSGGHRHCFGRPAYMAVLTPDHAAGDGTGKAVAGDGKPEF